MPFGKDLLAGKCMAVTRSVLWGMDRTTFRAILMHTTNEKRQLYENFLQEVPLLKTLNKYERSAIADVLQGQYFEKGQDIIVEGQCGDKLYFLEEGEADAKAGQKLTMKYRRGDYFGELALLHDQPRAATVTAVTQCKCVTIDRESFKVVEILVLA
ncbi:hypothetical protein O6H91_19G085700 [Diphasiastrum complanatum]|uniref:Uncharacterized protein n=1 Tax=Diphasiastrum complanatum TaxID=34168 RepID=A0ACC2AXD5_DIPCM|nr:hypothetical protein O6H91_19G085700 [Diphasiastrum complanatum]